VTDECGNGYKPAVRLGWLVLGCRTAGLISPAPASPASVPNGLMDGSSCRGKRVGGGNLISGWVMEQLCIRSMMINLLALEKQTAFV